MLLRTLGGLALDGSSFRRPKPLLLLAYLSIEGPADRGRLATLFWPNHDMPRQNLAVAVSQLRAAVPEALSSDDGRLVAHVDCDARELVSAVTGGDWRQALESYRGTFLESYPVGVGEELETWILETRDYLGGIICSLLVEGALDQVESGDVRQALDLAERAFRLYESGIDLEAGKLEGLHFALSELKSPHAAALRKTAAELGVEIGAFTRPRASHPFSEAAAVQLPPKPASRLIGREQELGELLSLLARDTRLITVTGLSGVGKSRLALELCHQVVENRTFDRALFVRMEPVSQPEAALGHLASSVGLTLTPGDGAASELARFLDAHRTLLVLDNMEHLTAWGPRLEELVARTERLAVVTTSTQPLASRDETLFFLEGLKLTPSPEDPHTPGSAAVRFFEERARRSMTSFSAEDSLAAVWQICSLVGGLPLGLELAAGLVRVLSIEELAKRLQERPEEIAAVTGGVPERHQSLLRTCEHAWAFLEESERSVLAALSVFKESFTVPDLEAVCGPALAELARLERRSLVRRAGDRYALHPLIKRFASERLAEDAAAELAARDKHAERMADVMWQYFTRTDVRTEGEAVRAAERALPDAIAAWHWSIERGAGENIAHLIPMVQSTLNGRGRNSVWNELIDRALDRLDHLPAAALELHLLLAGRTRDDMHMARTHVKAAAVAAVASGDTVSENVAALALAVLDDSGRRHKSTRALFRKALRHFRDAGAWSLVPASYANLSMGEPSVRRHGELLALGLRYMRRHRILSTDTPLVYFLAVHFTDSCGDHRAALDVTLEHLHAVEEALAQPFLLVDLHSMAAYYSLNLGDIDGGKRHHDIAAKLTSRRSEAPDFEYWAEEFHWMPWAAPLVALHTEGPEAALREGLERVHTVEARDLAVHVKLACGDRQGAEAIAEGWHERLRTHEVMRDDFHVQATRERIRATLATDGARQRRHLAAALRSCAEHHFVPLALDCMVSCHHLFPDVVSEQEAVEAATHPAAYHSAPLFLTGFRCDPPKKVASAPYPADEVLRRSAALASRLEADVTAARHRL